MISQDDRLISIATTLGDNTFVKPSFSGAEKLSGLFRFKLELASVRIDITFEQNEGIYYFFEHEDAKHTLVFANSSDNHQHHIAGAKKVLNG